MKKGFKINWYLIVGILLLISLIGVFGYFYYKDAFGCKEVIFRTNSQDGNYKENDWIWYKDYGAFSLYKSYDGLHPIMVNLDTSTGDYFKETITDPFGNRIYIWHRGNIYEAYLSKCIPELQENGNLKSYTFDCTINPIPLYWFTYASPIPSNIVTSEQPVEGYKEVCA